MAKEIDSAILKALSVKPENATIRTHGGSGFSKTFKIETDNEDGEKKSYFVKTGGSKSGIMFEGEHTSLNAIHKTVSNFCPASQSHGALSSSQGYFLITDFLNLSSTSSSSKGSGLSLASKLAKLHSAPTPTSEFGFPIPTCCGETIQDNTYKSSWSDFYANNRLLHILSCSQKTQGHDGELSKLVNSVASTVVPRLLSNGHLKDGKTGEDIKPALVHGDLWSGNHGRGTIGEGGVEEVVYDPSSAYCHSEFEFGIMKMFGGFGTGFNEEYFKIKPKDEPVEEWDDRVLLYELYHHLNHYSMFGGSYKGGAMSIMRKLLKKYGD